MASNQILINTTPKTDAPLCAWIDAAMEKYPGYASRFIKIALRHFIDTGGEHLNLGKVPVIDSDYPFKKKQYAISITLDPQIISFRDDLKKEGMVIKGTILRILNDSLETDENITYPYVKSYGELIDIPMFAKKRILTEPLEPVNTAAEQADQTVLIKKESISVKMPDTVTPAILTPKNTAKKKENQTKTGFSSSFMMQTGLISRPQDD